MILDSDEVEAVYYAVADSVRSRRISHRFIPAPVLQVLQRLDAHVRMSSRRHENSCDTDDLKESDVWIGTRAAASLLGMDVRWVQRHKNEIGGHINGGRLFFRESDVIDFHTERQARARINP